MNVIDCTTTIQDKKNIIKCCLMHLVRNNENEARDVSIKIMIDFSNYRKKTMFIYLLFKKNIEEKWEHKKSEKEGKKNYQSILDVDFLFFTIRLSIHYSLHKRIRRLASKKNKTISFASKMSNNRKDGNRIEYYLIIVNIFLTNLVYIYIYKYISMRKKTICSFFFLNYLVFSPTH